MREREKRERKREREKERGRERKRERERERKREREKAGGRMGINKFYGKMSKCKCMCVFERVTEKRRER